MATACKMSDTVIVNNKLTDMAHLNLYENNMMVVFVTMHMLWEINRKLKKTILVFNEMRSHHGP